MRNHASFLLKDLAVIMAVAVLAMCVGAMQQLKAALGKASPQVAAQNRVRRNKTCDKS
jgi:hypothetical protein